MGDADFAQIDQQYFGIVFFAHKNRLQRIAFLETNETAIHRRNQMGVELDRAGRPVRPVLYG